jgi:hypothetical protein
MVSPGPTRSLRVYSIPRNGRTTYLNEELMRYAKDPERPPHQRDHIIRVDEEVFAWIQSQAEAFVDSPNSVLRKVMKKCRVVEPARRK